MKKGIFRHIFALAATALAATASAQGITESVTVDGRYTPEIIPADRLPLLPATISLTAPESPMAYDRDGVSAAFAPDALSMPATAWRARKVYDTARGYLDLWLGSWLNSSLSAGYAAISNDDTRLNVWLQHNSTSLWQAWKEDAATGRPAADRRFRYDETVGADVSQRFSDAGMLTAGVQYHLGYFNYYATDQGPEEDGHFKAPTQTLNDAYARVVWRGTEYRKLKYSAEANVRYFGYRAMYPILCTVRDPWDMMRMKGERETVVNAGGDVSYGLSDGSGNGSTIGTGLLYSGVINEIKNNVHRIELTPAYVLTGRNYTLRLGANLAIVGVGKRARFRAAPDVRLGYSKGITTFSATVGGGTYLRTMAWMHDMNYYENPGIGCYNAAYSPLDIRLGLQFNPGGRWTAGVEGLWNTTLDETFGGTYQVSLNNKPVSMPDSPYGSHPENYRIHGFSIGVNAGYEFSRYFSLKGKVSWQPQDGSKGILNGFDRPELTADISAESKPTDKVSLRLDYRLRAKRELLPGSVSRLNLSAGFRISDKISVGAELNNLLNRHEEYLPGLPMEGFNALAGVQVVF